MSSISYIHQTSLLYSTLSNPFIAQNKFESNNNLLRLSKVRKAQLRYIGVSSSFRKVANNQIMNVRSAYFRNRNNLKSRVQALISGFRYLSEFSTT
jgi:phospholipase/lecithinase/hemolysin